MTLKNTFIALSLNKIKCLSLTFIFTAFVAYSQQQPFGLNINQPSSFRYDFYQPTVFPSSYLKDSINFSEKKIRTITLYRNGSRAVHETYDSLGRITNRISYRGTDTSDIVTHAYYHNKTVKTVAHFFSRKKESEVRLEIFKNGTEISSGIYYVQAGNGDSTKRIIEKGNEVFYQMYHGGKLTDLISRKYSQNNELIYEEINDYRGKHVLEYNPRGSLLKDIEIYRDGLYNEQIFTYNEKNLLIKSKLYRPKIYLDSTLYFYNESDSLVNRMSYYNYGEGKEQGTENENRIYDNTHRLAEIKIIRNYNSKDTSHVIVAYDGKGNNFTQYQYRHYMANNRQNAPKIHKEFSGDTVTQTDFISIDIFKINSANFTNDSMYLPNEKTSSWDGKWMSRSLFRNGKWDLFYTARFDSYGNLLEQSGNTEWQSDTYGNGGNLHCKYEYDQDGHCTRAIAKNDTGAIMYNFRLNLNKRRQILITDYKESIYGNRDYDSLHYDGFGRLVYRYRYSSYDTTVVQNTYCGKFLCDYSENKNGKKTLSMIATYENDLPVREEIRRNDFYNKQGELSEWMYTFYK